jgi:hypothetical protein
MLWLRNFDNAEDAGPKVHAELSKINRTLIFALRSKRLTMLALIAVSKNTLVFVPAMRLTIFRG